MDHPERECVTCGERGHWYLNCPRVPFFALAAAAFGGPALGLPGGDIARSIEMCAHCGGMQSIRNPRGDCDHLCWPDRLTDEAKIANGFKQVERVVTEWIKI